MWRIRYGNDAKVRSAFCLVMPAARALSEYNAPNPNSISESDLAMCVEERWTMVTSAPTSQSAAAMSWAELFDPITTTFFPRYASGPGCLDEWCCSPLKTSMPSNLGTLGLPDMPVASTSCFGRSVISTPSRSTTTVHSLAFSSYEAFLHSVEPQ